MEETKECLKCHEIKAVTEFPKGEGRCKKCVAEYYRKWRANNKERVRESSHKRYVKNKERIKESSRKWRAENGERDRELRREWKAKNKERLRGLGNKWRAENKERIAKIQRKSNLKQQYKLSLQEYDALLNQQKNACSICKLPFALFKEKERGVDHDHATGKVRGILCRDCNLALAYVHDNVKTLQGAIDYLSRQEGGFK